MEATTRTKKFPTRSDYEVVVKHLSNFALSPQLRCGRVELQSNGLFPKTYSGGRAVVYPFTTSTGRYALKCWIQNLGELEKRYRRIDEFLSSTNFKYMVSSSYHENELLVNGNRYPVVQMEWIDSMTMKEWIGSNINDVTSIQRLANEFYFMVQEMHRLGISHGDLQHDNILVRSDGSLMLVDYDSIFIPGLETLSDEIKGLPGYQHPSRKNLPFCSPRADYFSELVIYISLMALSMKPNLWNSIKDENRLLIAESDILDPHNSITLDNLERIAEIAPLVNTLREFCTKSSLEVLVPLDDIVSPKKINKTPHVDHPKPSTGNHWINENTSQSAQQVSIRKAQVWQPPCQNGSDPWHFPHHPTPQHRQDQRSAQSPTNNQTDDATGGSTKSARTGALFVLETWRGVHSKCIQELVNAKIENKKSLRLIAKKSGKDMLLPLSTIASFNLSNDKLVILLRGDDHLVTVTEPPVNKILLYTLTDLANVLHIAGIEYKSSAESGLSSPSSSLDMTKLSSEGSSSSVPNTKPASDCFVATAVYRDSRHPDVCKLRTLRDTVLCKHWTGRALIVTYKRVGPPLAWIVRHTGTDRLLRPLFRSFVSRLP